MNWVGLQTYSDNLELFAKGCAVLLASQGCTLFHSAPPPLFSLGGSNASEVPSANYPISALAVGCITHYARLVISLTHLHSQFIAHAFNILSPSHSPPKSHHNNLFILLCSIENNAGPVGPRIPPQFTSAFKSVPTLYRNARGLHIDRECSISNLLILHTQLPLMANFSADNSLVIIKQSRPVIELWFKTHCSGLGASF